MQVKEEASFAASHKQSTAMGEIQNTLEILVSKFDELRTENKEMREENKEIRKDIQTMEKKLELNKTNYNKSLEDLHEKLCSLTTLKEENDHLRGQQQIIREKVNETQERLKNLNTEKVKLQRENEKLSLLNEETIALKTENECLKQNVSTLEQEIKLLQDKAEKLENDNGLLDDQKRKLETEIKTKNEEIFGIKEKVHRLESITNAEKNTLLQIEASIAEIKTKVDLNTRARETEQNFKQENKQNGIKQQRPFNNRTNKPKTFNIQYGYNNQIKINKR